MANSDVQPIPEGYQRVTPYLIVDGAAAATGLRTVEDKFYGDRSGDIEDPFGHRWSLATHVEDVSPEEMQRRMEAGGAA